MRAHGLESIQSETDQLTVGNESLTSLNPNRGKNLLINGNFDIWQRATSFSATGYFADRWKSNNLSGATYTFSRQLETAAFKQSYYGRLDVTAGSSAPRGIEQRIEEVVTAGGDTVTLSFYAKTDVARTITVRLDQNYGSGGSSTVSTTTEEVVTTTSWVLYTFTWTLGSTSGKTIGAGNYLGVVIRMKDITSGTLDIGQVQLEVGNEASDFEFRSLGEELALCQRYYEKSYDLSIFPGASSAGGMSWVYMVNSSATLFSHTGKSVKYRVEKRAVPTVAAYSSSGGSAGYARDWGNGQDVACNLSGGATSGFYWYCTLYASGATASIAIQWTADAEL